MSPPLYNHDLKKKKKKKVETAKIHIVKATFFFPPVIKYGYKSWTIKKTECQRINSFKLWCWKTLESPLDYKEMNSGKNPGWIQMNKANQPWIFIGRNYTESETSILWPRDGKNQLIGKDPNAGKDWGQEQKGMTEDEVVGWHHCLNGHEFEQALGQSERQGNLVCFEGVTESDMTWQLNNNQIVSH